MTELSTYYRILSANSISDMTEWVRDHLKVGWKLKGGVSVVLEGEEYTFFQAMTIISDERPSELPS